MGVLVITDEKTIERDAHTYVRYWTAAKFVRKTARHSRSRNYSPAH